jgi:hypothetical protein
MRASTALLLALACACSSARPKEAAGPAACDLLPILGAVRPEAIASDPDGGLAVVGTSRTGRVRAGASSLENAPAFILRTAPDGSVRWMRGLASGRPLAVAIAGDDVVVAGESQRRCFVARYSSDGRSLWNVALAGESTSACRAVAVNAQGDVFAAGVFSGALGPARSGGTSDAFVVRSAAATGDMRLVRALGGAGTDSADAIAVLPSGDVVVGGAFGGDVDASVSTVDLGRGQVRAAGGADGYLLTLTPEGATRSVSIASEAGEDRFAVVAAGPGGAAYALLTVHADRNAVGCSGDTVVARAGEWARVLPGCVTPRGLAADDAGRVWALLQAGRGLRALALSPRDGDSLGSRGWSQEGITVRGAGIARVPGGLALAADTDGELIVCGKPVGSTGELTGFLLWQRDLAVQ